MITNTLTLRHIVFKGENIEPVSIKFEKGLNVLYGASETGKSFVLETIDFMLGGQDPLRDIPERSKYDSILLGIEASDNDVFTLVRSSQGGDFAVYAGLHQDLPVNQTPIILKSAHKKNDTSTLSYFLLQKINLENKLVKKNAKGETRNLTFRDMCHLILIDENKIQKKGSPLETSGQLINKTVEYSIFKLLLTGIDDSSIVSSPNKLNRANIDNSQLEIVEEILNKFSNKIGFGDSFEELSAQLKRAEKSIVEYSNEIISAENQWNDYNKQIREIKNEIEICLNRNSEIDELIARFNLLNGHYLSDLQRLEGIKEAGTLLDVLDLTKCPLCGADPDHFHPDEDSYGNMDLIISASEAESKKIRNLQDELLNTIEDINKEKELLDPQINFLKKEESIVQNRINELRNHFDHKKNNYNQLIETKSNILYRISIFEEIKSLIEIKENITNKTKNEEVEEPTNINTNLSTSVLDEYAQIVEKLLKDWNFPDSDRVQFDESTKDIIISGKQRSSRGKGMRSITHSAFIIGILLYCNKRHLPHPGFLVLDSPLLAYREPENEDDDLSKTDVQNKFYDFITKMNSNQVIIIENIDPPLSISKMKTSTLFSKNISSGRYGLFPLN